MAKVGRNDKCPCGSGKKYKNCCGASAGMNDTPPSNVIAIRADQKIPDGFRLKARLYGKRSEYRDPQIEEMTAEYIVEFRALGRNIEDSIRDCKHKLYGVKWHRDSFKEVVEKECDSISETGPRVIGIPYEEEHLSMVYLFEGFLFQVKSSVEMLEDFVIKVYGLQDAVRSDLNDGDKGKASWGALKNALNLKGASAVAQTVEKYAGGWLGQLSKMRNEVAHKSRLKDFRCIVEDTPQMGMPTTIVKPRTPNGDDAVEYCDNILKQLIKLHDEVFMAVMKTKAQVS